MHKFPIKKQGKKITQELCFQSWGEALRYLEETPRTAGAEQSSDRESYSGNSWALGCDSLADAIKMARSGWKQGRERVKARARHLETRIINRVVKQEMRFDVCGMDFDIGRVVARDPECWYETQDEQHVSDKGERHVKIVMNICASAGIPAETLAARGAAVAALVELLEFADHRVELWVVDARNEGWKGEGIEFAFMVRVKAYDQPLDIDRVAFACAHPAMLRRLGFKASETADKSIVRAVATSGYGQVRNHTDPTASVCLKACHLYDREVDWTSPESAETWILGQLAEQGIILRDV